MQDKELRPGATAVSSHHAKESPRDLVPRKSKADRVLEHQTERALQLILESTDLRTEDEGERRARVRRLEEESDRKLFEDLLGFDSCSDSSSTSDAGQSSFTLGDLSHKSVFNPETREEFLTLRETLLPILSRNSQNPHYGSFLVELIPQLARDLPAEEVRKIESMLIRIFNEKVKKEREVQRPYKKASTQKRSTS